LQHLSLAGNALGRLAASEARGGGWRSLLSLNLALNCLRRFPSPEVSRALESLERLDLTANFLDAPALLALGTSLGEMPRLSELWLAGNPAVEAVRRVQRGGSGGGAGARRGQKLDKEEEDEQDDKNDDDEQQQEDPLPDMYRACVLLALPRLARLDGEAATASERLAARRAQARARAALLQAAAEADAAAAAPGEQQQQDLAALEKAVVAGEEHPETLALYGLPEEAARDETSESEGEGESGSAAETAAPVNAAAANRPCHPRRPRIAETGKVDPHTGDLRRPWCPATRLLDLRDQRRQQQQAARGGNVAAGASSSSSSSSSSSLLSSSRVARPRPRHAAMPPLPEDDPGTGETLPLRNEGRWRYSLDLVTAGAGRSSAAKKQQQQQHLEELELDVDVGRHVDTSSMQLEVLPRAVRLLVRGRLLQLRLPGEVRADAGAARRSHATGRLVVRMPLLRRERRGKGLEKEEEEVLDPSLVRPRWSVWGEKEEEEEQKEEKEEAGVVGAAAAAVVVVCRRGEDDGSDGSDDDDGCPPPL
jgi:hypothetical protein